MSNKKIKNVIRLVCPKCGEGFISRNKEEDLYYVDSDNKPLAVSKEPHRCNKCYTAYKIYIDPNKLSIEIEEF